MGKLCGYVNLLPACMSRTTAHHAGCSKKLSGKTAANEEARRMLRRIKTSARRGWAGEKVDFLCILLEEIANKPDRLFRRGSGMNKMRREIFEQAYPGLISS